MNPLRARSRIADAAALLTAGFLSMGADNKGCGGDGTMGATDASGGSCTLDASAYDQSCQVDSDCVEAFLGNVCTDDCVGDCANTAIRSSESARYNADLAATSARMAHPNGGTCSCALGPAFCRAGTCDIHSPREDAGTSDAPGQCRWPDTLNDAGPGVRACGVGRVFLECTYPSGVGCTARSSGTLTELCVSDDPTKCSDCATLPSGATCRNLCGSGEYAVSCGGPPLSPLPDGEATAVYQDPPQGCVAMGITPAGNTYGCCPCQ
jgi:hypothetical protein